MVEPPPAPFSRILKNNDRGPGYSDGNPNMRESGDLELFKSRTRSKWLAGARGRQVNLVRCRAARPSNLLQPSRFFRSVRVLAVVLRRFKYYGILSNVGVFVVVGAF